METTRGKHGNHPAGGKHYMAKGWILFKNEDMIGYFPTVKEAGLEVGLNGHYLWLLYKGRYNDKDGNTKCCTSDGYRIEPAKVIEHRG